MKRLSAVLFILLLASISHAQQTWWKTYGGSGSDQGWDVRQTQDGGYIFAGIYEFGGTNTQVYLIRTNASGDTLWTRTYGGTGDERGYSVRQTSDGNFIVAGRTTSFGDSVQFYLLKISPSGDTLWTRAYGGPGYECGFCVQQTADSGYIISGVTTSFGNGYQIYLVKTNASGDSLWTRAYGGTGDEYSFSIQQTQDGGYIVAGMTNSNRTDFQVYLLKADSLGDTLWTRSYGGTFDDYGYSVQQTQDGGYIVAGVTGNYSLDPQVYLLKTDASGDTLWTKTYGGAGRDFGQSVQQTQDGGYIVAGWTTSFGHGGSDAYLLKTDALGDTLWTKAYGDTGYDLAYSVRQTQDGGYIIAGCFNDVWPNGDVYLIKTDGNGNVGVEDKAVSSPISRLPLTVRPNPFASFTKIPGHEAERFALYDISGRRVGTYRGDRVGEGLAAGVYFLKAEKGVRKPLRIVKVR